MSHFLFQYHAVSPTTWVYLSSLLSIALFFKFSRLWSMRNLDLLILISLAPGLLIVHFGNQLQEVALQTESPGNMTEAADEEPHRDAPDGIEAVSQTSPEESKRMIAAKKLEGTGYFWLMTVSVVLFFRCLLDTRLVRRPLWSPNLAVGGMTFLGVALFLFLMANVISQDYLAQGVDSLRLDRMLAYQHDRGPGYAALDALPGGGSKIAVVISHLCIVVGMIVIAYRHFGNITNGIGAATLYLLLPYTSQMTSRLDHFLPAALLLGAILFYRRPLIAGILIGVAFGFVYYPLFLIPLWVSFYWKRGRWRFLAGVLLAVVTMAAALSFVPGSGSLGADLQRMFGLLRPAMDDLEGVWNTDIGGIDPFYRVPVLAAAVVLSLSMMLWPAQKTLATLICGTAAVMITSQFWHGFGGGLFIAWYVPLVLLMVFRPNLEDRVAQTVVIGKRNRAVTAA